MLRRILLNVPVLIALALVSLMSFSAVAFAADAAVPSDGSILDIVTPIFHAFSGGHYAYAAALLVVLLVAAVKRYGYERLPWVHSDAGGCLLALLGAAAAAVGTALASPEATVTWSLLETALMVGVGAAGGFAMIKHLLIEPLLRPLAEKVPTWMRPLFLAILWIFDKPTREPVAPATPVAPAVPTSPDVTEGKS